MSQFVQTTHADFAGPPLLVDSQFAAMPAFTDRVKCRSKNIIKNGGDRVPGQQQIKRHLPYNGFFSVDQRSNQTFGGTTKSPLCPADGNGQAQNGRINNFPAGLLEEADDRVELDATMPASFATRSCNFSRS